MAEEKKEAKDGKIVVQVTQATVSKRKATIEYWPAMLLFGVGAGSIIASDCIYSKRSAALAAAYTMSETAYRVFTEKAVERLGEDKTREIQEEKELEATT